MVHGQDLVGDGQAEAQVLLDGQQAQALGPETPEQLADLTDHEGNETLGGLVEQ